ncbi:hypothetical protein C8Q73DRAFT_668612 [Cubamyces lactineus]|nr:hypothetical protein C8Q73DRAFT_668612 [Cubamyces lactineus]
MAFIRPTRPTDGVPRRGRTSLPQVSPPSVTASAAFEVPGVVAPWEFGQHLDVYLLCDAIIRANGRSRRGHAVLMFEDATDLLPALVSPPPPGLPPAPGAAPISISLSPSHDSPSPVPNDDEAANFIVSSILQATRPGTPVVSTTSRNPLNSFHPPLVSVVEEPGGEYALAFTLPTDLHEALQKLEEIVSAWRTDSKMKDAPGWTTLPEEEADVQDDGTEDGEVTAREDEPIAAPTGDGTSLATALDTPEDPTPAVSPLSTTASTPEASPVDLTTVSATQDVPYNLRPRPVPRKRYHESPGRVRPQLALPGAERAELDHLLDVPARQWTKDDRRLLRAVVLEWLVIM